MMRLQRNAESFQNICAYILAQSLLALTSVLQATLQTSKAHSQPDIKQIQIQAVQSHFTSLSICLLCVCLVQKVQHQIQLMRISQVLCVQNKLPMNNIQLTLVVAYVVGEAVHQILAQSLTHVGAKPPSCPGCKSFCNSGSQQFVCFILFHLSLTGPFHSRLTA